MRPVINACGIYTDVGGSLRSPEIMVACSELNQSWIRMTELLDRTGELIAGWLDVPAVRVTPGALKTVGNSRGTTADELNMAIDSPCAAKPMIRQVN